MSNCYKTLSEFYPTPPELMAKMFLKIDGKISDIKSVLDPSAGSGNLGLFFNEILDYAYDRNFIKSRFDKENISMEEAARVNIEKYCVDNFERHLKQSNLYFNRQNIIFDCIETNSELRSILRDRNFNVVGSDFLQFKTESFYDLIIMNPPFSDGAKHLLKAIKIGKKGGSQIICLLNAETIKNPFSNERKALLQELNKYDAQFEYVKDAFVTADHSTRVEVVIVSLTLPDPFENRSHIWESLQEKEYEIEDNFDTKELVSSDLIHGAVQMYQREVEAGKKLIVEFFSLKPYLSIIFEKENDDRFYLKNKTTLVLSSGDCDSNEDKASPKIMFNVFLKKVRHKYWSELLSNPIFFGNLPTNLQNEYRNQVNDLCKYDFNVSNICDVKLDILRNTADGFQKAILDLFEKLTYSYSMECEGNIHYFNGWKTNKAYVINRKVIAPVYAYDSIFGKFKYTYGNAMFTLLSDIEKIFNYFDGGETTCNRKLSSSLEYYEDNQETKNLQFKYFTINVYKKGTIHIKFTNPELLKKFNLYGCMRKGWLPPSYGKKAYKDMTDEEKAVIDDFQGEMEYSHVFQNKDKYIFNPEKDLLALPM